MNSNIKRMGVIALAAVCGSAYAFDYSGGVGGSIPDAGGGPFSMSIVVSGTGETVNTLDLAGALGLAHTWAGDLTVVLSHGGVEVDLMDRNYAVGSGLGLSSDLDGDYMFDESGVLMSGNPIPSGTYGRYDLGGSSAATGSYSDFSGMALDGTWTLTFEDWAGGDIGTVQGMRIVGTSSPVPEPASMMALGLGAAALLRRRRKA